MRLPSWLSKRMNADYLKTLREQDVAVDQRSQKEQIESWKHEQSNVFKLAHAISVSLGDVEKVESGSYFQDANYYAEILMHISDFPKGIWEVSIRLSNFGNFVAVIDEKSALKSKHLETLKEIFKQHGYFYIPMDVLKLKYDGEKESSGDNWFHRYFDY